MEIKYSVVGALVLILTGSLFYACQVDTRIFTSGIPEGRIHYSVTYPEMGDDNMMSSILPDEMTVTFKGDRYNSEFNTYGGVFKNKVSIDGQKQSYSQAMKVFKKKLACDYKQHEIEEMLQDFPPFTIIESDMRDTIAGIPCRVAHGVFYDLISENIDIYYTDQIDVHNPNWCSPFDQLDGFLMGYDIDMFDLRLRLIATEVMAEQIAESEFVIEDDYKRVSYEYIRTEIEKLMSSFDI